METPDWNKEFEIMCDVSYYAMGAMLGKKQTRPSKLYIMLARLLMKHKRIIQPLIKKCLQWCLIVRSLGHIYWGLMS